MRALKSVLRVLNWWDTYVSLAVALLLTPLVLSLCESQVLEAAKAVAGAGGAVISVPVAMLALLISVMDNDVKAKIVSNRNGKPPVLDTLFFQYGVVTSAWVISIFAATMSVITGQREALIPASKVLLIAGLCSMTYVLLATPTLIVSAKRSFGVLGTYYASRQAQSGNAEKGSGGPGDV